MQPYKNMDEPIPSLLGHW